MIDAIGYSIASVIKKFFTKLLTPVFPYKIYSKILSISSIKEEDEVLYLKDIFGDLPTLNYQVLVYLVSFLRKEIIPKQDQNKMNNYNMSVVFNPCFFRAETPSHEDLLFSGKFAGVLHIFLNRF